MAEKGFMLFSNQRKLLALMTDEQKGRLLDALFAHNDGEETPIDDPLVSMAFMVITESIARVQAHNAKQKANGSKGGRPKATPSQDIPTETQNNPDKPNYNPKKPENENENININTPLSPNGDMPPTGGDTGKKKIVHPTADEVQAYCDERNNAIDGESFVDYYAAQGWKLANGQPLKDWKAAVRTWERHANERKQTAATVPKATTVAQQRSLERQMMAQMLLDDRRIQNAHGNRIAEGADGAQLALPPGW